MTEWLCPSLRWHTALWLWLLMACGGFLWLAGTWSELRGPSLSVRLMLVKAQPPTLFVCSAASFYLERHILRAAWLGDKGWLPSQERIPWKCFQGPFKGTWKSWELAATCCGSSLPWGSLWRLDASSVNTLPACTGKTSNGSLRSHGTTLPGFKIFISVVSVMLRPQIMWHKFMVW